MKITNKVVVVTGAGSGIGRSLTVELLARGARVAAVDRNEETLRDLSIKASAGEKLSMHVVDITNRSNVEHLVAEVIEQHQNVDVIINNAGIIQPFITVNELDYDAIERVMNVNFYGTLYMVKSFLPTLLTRPTAHIVNVSSMGGFLPVPGQSIYGASKAAVKLMSEGLYAELKDTNVDVSVVFPGATETNITQNSNVDVPKMSQDTTKKFPALSSEKAAIIIIDGIEKNKIRILTGRDSKLMDRLYRLNPVYATNLIAKQMRSLLQK